MRFSFGFSGCFVLLAAGSMAGSIAWGGQGQDRVLWRFRLNSYVAIQHAAVGSDGVVVAQDDSATYAINPDGSLRWVSLAAGGKDGGGGRAIDFGADGTIYCGIAIVGDAYAPVVALNPDGSTRWIFESGTANSTLVAGPNVGPNGNIFGIEDAADGGLGAFALDPAGNLLWSNQGDPLLDRTLPPSTISEIVFGADRLHAGVVFRRSGNNPVTYTFDLNGAQLWTTWGLQPHAFVFPVVDPFNRVILGSGQVGLLALSPDRDRQWLSPHPNGISAIARPAIDSSGFLYSGDFVGVDLWSLNPDGSTRWVRPPEAATYFNELGVTPDDSVIVAGGSDVPDGGAGEGWVRGFSSADGAQLWQVDLLEENGLSQFVSSRRPAFSADSQTAYVTTHFEGSANDYGYVVAIRVQNGGAGTVQGDFNCDGVVSAGDIGPFVLALTDPGKYAALFSVCDMLIGDLNHDGLLTVADIAGFVQVLTGG